MPIMCSHNMNSDPDGHLKRCENPVKWTISGGKRIYEKYCSVHKAEHEIKMDKMSDEEIKAEAFQIFLIWCRNVKYAATHHGFNEYESIPECYAIYVEGTNHVTVRKWNQGRPFGHEAEWDVIINLKGFTIERDVHV